MTSSAHVEMLPRSHRRDAFALVIVIVLLSLMTIIVVGYLSSMSSERATASAFSNKARAEQAAQAAVDAAAAILRDYFKAFPDSATVWDPAQYKNPDGSSSGGTTLYLRAVPQANNSNLPDPAPGVTTDPNYSPNADYKGGNGPNNGWPTGSDARKTFVLPLVSGAAVNLLANKASTMQTLSVTNSINLNSRRQTNDTQGWLGTPPGYTSPGSLPKPVYAPWVEIKQQDGLKKTDPAPVVARYAFWVEDESFRTNISYAGQGAVGTGGTPTHLRRDNSGNNALNPSDLDLLGLLQFIGDPAPGTTSQNLVNARNVYPSGVFPEARAFTHASGLGTDSINKLRYLTTSQSAALNLSRHGTERLNLNDVIYPPTGAAYGTVQNQIDKIVQTIKFHAPNFGQRFYRLKWSGNPPVVAASDLNSLVVTTPTTTTPPNPPYAPIYLYKVAANLRDYIDADVLPTVITAGDSNGENAPVWSGGRPTAPYNANDAPNTIWAFGKDAAPVIQECAMRYSGTASTGANGRYTAYLDYYIEFWNMSDRQITGQDLGPNAFVRIRDQAQWFGDNTGTALGNPPALTDDSGISLTDVVPRDFDIDISNVIFKPGAATVVTTDPDWQSAVFPASSSIASISDVNPANRTEAATHFAYCPISSPGGKRMFTGPMPQGCNELRMVYRYKTASISSDYETEVIAGNDKGFIDSVYGGLPIVGGTISIPRAGSARVVNGGYLRGNVVHGYAADGSTNGGLQPSELADPRTNNEQLYLTLHVSTDPATDQTGYKEFDINPALANQILPSFGLPNINSLAPAKPKNPWPDYYWFPGSPVSPGNGAVAAMNAANAPAVYANAPLLSIGQLGDIFDPARLPDINNSNADIPLSRGGGRTFKIGQHDDLFDKTVAAGGVYSASSTWASWRLADFFATSDAIEQPGLININGLTRDNGAALMAAFQGFNFQPQTQDPGTPGYDSMLHDDASIAGKAFDATGLQKLINDIITSRLNNTDPTLPGPFFERGELSETPILNPANSTSTSLVSGVDMKSVFDRGREELVRRLIEMTTTRGSVFTVYALGQSISQSNPADAATKRVTGIHQLRVTFKLTPETIDGKPFHPATDANGVPTDFDPKDAAKVSARFLKPDHYDIQVLSATSGNS